MQSGMRVKNSTTVVHAAAATDTIPARPDSNGRYGKFGGKYVPETLISALEELEKAYAEAMADESFKVCWNFCGCAGVKGDGLVGLLSVYPCIMELDDSD